MRAATFSTLITAQTDPGLEQAFTRQAQIAQSSYATITRAAEQATRATAGLLGGRGTQGAGVGTQQVQQRANAIRQTTTAAAAAERATTRLATATSREAAAVTTSARAHAGLARNLTTTSVALNVVSGRLDPVASRLNTLTRAVTDLTGVQLGLAAFGATLFALGRTANGYANLEARVRPFFSTQKQVNAAMNDIIGIAKRSRSALEPVVDVYTRLTTVGQNIGLSRQRIGQVTEIATKASAIGGGSAQARDAALLQFGQALSGDFKAAGQEINSLKEQAPVLFQAILRGYKDTDGAIGITLARFKQLSEAGELSTAKVLDAVTRSASYIDEMAARVPNTLSRAGTDLSNALTVSIGRFDSAIGFTSLLADGISLVAERLRVIVSLAAGVATAFAAVKVVGLAQQAAQTVTGFVGARNAARELATTRAAGATASLAQHQREIAAIGVEQREIRETILLLEQQQLAARRDVGRAARDVRAGAPGAMANLSPALKEERDATQRLALARQQLIANGENLAGANQRVKASTDSLARATSFAARQGSLLRNVAGSHVAFLGGPWGIIFAAASTAVYLLASAQSAAEIATAKAEGAQRSFANSVDRSTGKVYDQIGALQKLSLTRQQGDAGQASLTQYKNSGNQILANLRPLLGSAGGSSFKTVNGFRVAVPNADRRTPEQKALADAYLSFQRGERGSVPRLQSVLARADVQRGVPGLAGRSGKLGELFDQLSARGSEVGRAAASQRILQGRARAGDVPRAFGEETRTTGGATKPLSKAQNEAAAATKAAQTELQRARADLQTLRATGKQGGESDDAYQDRLAAAMQRVTAAQKEQTAARSGASAGRAAERKAARDAIQDARDEAAAKRDAALVNLAKQGLNPVSEEFLAARRKILQTYDDEVNKLDASRAASSSAAAQQIADANRVAAAAAAAGEKRDSILSSYDDAPKPQRRADDQISDLRDFVGTAVDGLAFVGKTREEVEAIKKINPLGTGIYTQEIADADARRINDGLRRPLQEYQRDVDRGIEIAKLQIQGRDEEAAALEQRNRLLDAGVRAEDINLQQLTQNERTQARINDALASRQRITSLITGAVDQTRDSFEQLILDLPEKGRGAGVDFLKSFQANLTRISVRQLTEKIFAGSDAKVRGLLNGKASVDEKIMAFGGSVDTLATTTGKVETGFDKVATAAEALSARLDGAANGTPSFGSGTGATSLLDTLSGGGSAFDASPVLRSLLNRIPDAGNETGLGDILVTGRKLVAATSTAKQPVTPPNIKTPSGKSVASLLGGDLFSGLDRLVDRIRGVKPASVVKKPGDLVEATTTAGGVGKNSTFFKGIGSAFGTALEGAGQGAIASGFAKALGIKQSGTGAQIGGAIGSFLPIPGGAIIGGLIGGTLGGLFKKPKTGASTVTLDSSGQLAAGAGFGNNAGARTAAVGSAKGVVDGLNSIAEALGAKITGSPTSPSARVTATIASTPPAPICA